MPITQFEGRALVFNNGVVDVVQGETSLVDENKVAHIPQSSVAIDNETIIENANHQLEVPIDEDTIYRDPNTGFIKAKQGGSGSVVVDNDTIIDSEGAIKVNEDKFLIKDVKPAFSFEENTFTYDTENTIWNGSLPFTQDSADALCDKFTVDNEIPIKVDIYHDGLTEPLSKVVYSYPNATQYDITSFSVSFYYYDAEEHETDISVSGNIVGDGSQWIASEATVYAMTYGDADPVSTFSSVEKVVVSLPEFATFKVNPSNLPERPDESDYKWGIYYDGNGNIKLEQGQYGNAYQTANEVLTAISNQTSWMSDSINELQDSKQDTLTAGTNISIENNVIRATVTSPITRLGYGTPELGIQNEITIVEDASNYIITGEGGWHWVGPNRYPELYDTVMLMSPSSMGQGAFFITHMQLVDENDNPHHVQLLDTTLGDEEYDSDKSMSFFPAYFSKGEDEDSTQITANGVIKFYQNNTAEITLPKAYCNGYTLKNENTVVSFMLPAIYHFTDSYDGALYHSLLPGYSNGYWTVSYTGERNTNI